MRRFFLLLLYLFSSNLNAQLTDDPSAVKPYRAVLLTGIELHEFDKQFKAFSLALERPLNLYTHIGVQGNIFFGDGPFEYRSIKNNSFEAGIYAKCFFHGRFTGRRSKTYLGPDFRYGKRTYNPSVLSSFDPLERTATTLKLMLRIGWQYHLGPAILEISLPIGYEKERFRGSDIFFAETSNNWFVAAPGFSLGIGF